MLYFYSFIEKHLTKRDKRSLNVYQALFSCGSHRLPIQQANTATPITIIQLFRTNTAYMSRTTALLLGTL